MTMSQFPVACRQTLRLSIRCRPSQSQQQLPSRIKHAALTQSARCLVNEPQQSALSAGSVETPLPPTAQGETSVIESATSYGQMTVSDGMQPEKDEDLSPMLLNISPEKRAIIARARIPKSLQAMYNRPLKRTPTHGNRVCNLQIRSFSVRNLELQADFAMRAAYYLGLPAKGPVPLPQIVQRWTVPRSNFIHKKSQENFERVHLRRLIQIQDGDAEVVQCWLGYLRQRSYHGIGMKAYMWENEGLGVGKRMDEAAGHTDVDLESEWGNFGMRMNVKTAEAVEDLLGSEAFSKPRRDMEAYWREPVEIVRKKVANHKKSS